MLQRHESRKITAVTNKSRKEYLITTDNITVLC